VTRLDRALRWPLWCWRNLVVTLVVLLLLLSAAGRVSASLTPAKGADGGPARPAAVRDVPARTAPAAGGVPTTPARPAPVRRSSPGPTPPGPRAPRAEVPGPTAPAGPGQSVTRVAEAFARAWSRSSLPLSPWLSGVRPWVTPTLAKGLSETDPGRIPATRVIGEAQLVRASRDSAAVLVPTDGGPITTTLRRVRSRWLVAGVAPAGQPPAAPTPSLAPPVKPTPPARRPLPAGR
jgi:hypothetical protein